MKNKTLMIYLLALLLMGIGYLGIMPVGEGFDENAHYSSLRQIADTGAIPIYGKDRLDQAMTGYNGPVAYNSLKPPFDAKMSYARFFKDPALVTHYLAANRGSEQRATYVADTDPKATNWQAQHPPTYYLLLAPLTRATDTMSLVAQTFILRLASYILALGGVVLGWFGARASSTKTSLKSMALGFLLYPIILPMFFPEFTRLGNDALCLLLTGLTAFLLSHMLHDENDQKLPLALGITLGIGLLTKAFFLPIAAAVGFFLLLRLQHERKNKKKSMQRFEVLGLVVAPALLIGGGWYIYKLAVFGDLTGSADAMRVAETGGLIANLKLHFSVLAFARSFLVTFVTWVWGGTWSLTRLPEVVELPSVILALWIVMAFITQVRRRPLHDPAWLPVWTFGIFVASLFYYAILTIALDGNGGAPGWYLHILLPWAAPALGIGIMSILKNARARPLFIALLIYTALFQIITFWSQMALFSGCATKGDDKHYVFSGPAYCLDQLPLMINHLSVLGWPLLAAIGFGGAIICAGLLTARWKTKTA